MREPNIRIKPIIPGLILIWFLLCPSGLLSQNPYSAGTEPFSGSDTAGVRKKSVQRTKNFYDSVYVRLNRHKITRMLYTLAFVAPAVSTLPDTVQALKSENPYLQYSGKVIRKIHILSLDPFGPTVIDTARKSMTGFGHFLNVVHLQTAPIVIRRMLLVRKGQRIDPFVLADQERLLKNLNFIDDARVIVVPSASEDSVDIVVVSKDVWSIAVDVPVITKNRVVARLYDANFLGLGDRLSVDFSIAGKRMPFFRFDGFSYTYSNIMGTFTDITFSYAMDEQHQTYIGLYLERPFFTNRTKYAGGLGYEYNNVIYNQTEFETEYSRYHSSYIWIGRSYLLKEYRVPTRFVVAAQYSATVYTQRQPINIETNSGYYDTRMFLTSISFSRNNYYLADYVLNFGKTENIPYGRLISFTFGLQWTNFYTRLYSGFSWAQGNFLKKFGYLQGRFDIGAFSGNRTFEDGNLVARLNYLSYLYFTPDRNYKFRTFVLTTYRHGFLRRSNNFQYSYLNQDLKIHNYSTDSVFRASHSLSLYYLTNMYTPWYFYGFRFAFMGVLAGGFMSDAWSNLFQSSFYSGIGIGLQIKNDNLVFPTFLLSAFVYPSPAEGVPWLQLNFSFTPDIQLKDYNVGAPSVVSLSQ